MIAYFCLSGKQFFAKEGDILDGCPYVDGVKGQIVFSEEVMCINEVTSFDNSPFIKNAKVELKILKQGKTKKIRVVKFISQKRHKRWKGHRSKYTKLQVLKIHWQR